MSHTVCGALCPECQCVPAPPLPRCLLICKQHGKQARICASCSYISAFQVLVRHANLRKGQLNRHTRCRPATTTRNTDRRCGPCGRVARWTNTPAGIIKDPDPPPVPRPSQRPGHAGTGGSHNANLRKGQMNKWSAQTVLGIFPRAFTHRSVVFTFTHTALLVFCI